VNSSDRLEQNAAGARAATDGIRRGDQQGGRPANLPCTGEPASASACLAKEQAGGRARQRPSARNG
jgi:hypothetical protein